MPYRIAPVVTGEIYHIFNRGVEKRSVFLDEIDYRRFYKTLVYYRRANVPTRFSFRSRKLLNVESKDDKQLIELLCFTLMPSHFHLLLRQLSDGGIANYVGRLTNSYTRYFNTKHKRVGHLFQGPYKAVIVETDEQLLHLSRYIHLNPLVGGVVSSLKSYRRSSYPEYLGCSKENVCRREEILNMFSEPREKKYEKFVLDQVDYARSLEKIKKELIDENLY